MFDGSVFSLHLGLQWAVLSVWCLGFVLLWGQGGLLHFGLALYAGAGAYGAAWALAVLGWPVCLAPVMGLVWGLVLAALLGLAHARQGGVAFAMVSLGLGELAHAAAQSWPAWFGGEGGWALDRGRFWGGDLAWAGLALAYVALAWLGYAVYARTRLALLVQGLRDGSARLAFVGYSPVRLRFVLNLLAAACAGLAGGLGALHVERVSAAVFAPERSGMLMVFGYLAWTLWPRVGGAAFLAALGWVGGQSVLGLFTPYWGAILGALFVTVVWVQGHRSRRAYDAGGGA